MLHKGWSDAATQMLPHAAFEMTGPTKAGPASEAVFGHHGSPPWGNMVPPARDNCSLGTPLQQFYISFLFHKDLSSQLQQTDHYLIGGLDTLKVFFLFQTVSRILTQVRQVSIPTYHTDFSRVSAHLQPHEKGTSPSDCIFKCKAAIYLPYTFGITSFCTRLLFKPCLSLRGADQLETKAPKMIRKFPIHVAPHHHVSDSNEAQHCGLTQKSWTR